MRTVSISMALNIKTIHLQHKENRFICGIIVVSRFVSFAFLIINRNTLSLPLSDIHAHTHICVCVCVCVKKSVRFRIKRKKAAGRACLQTALNPGYVRLNQTAKMIRLRAWKWEDAREISPRTSAARWAEPQLPLLSPCAVPAGFLSEGAPL